MSLAHLGRLVARLPARLGWADGEQCVPPYRVSIPVFGNITFLPDSPAGERTRYRQWRCLGLDERVRRLRSNRFGSERTGGGSMARKNLDGCGCGKPPITMPSRYTSLEFRQICPLPRRSTRFRQFMRRVWLRPEEKLSSAASSNLPVAMPFGCYSRCHKSHPG